MVIIAFILAALVFLMFNNRSLISLGAMNILPNILRSWIAVWVQSCWVILSPAANVTNAHTTKTKCTVLFYSVDPNDQKKTACYDIDVEVDDTLKTQMNSFLLSTASQQEIAGLDNKVQQRVLNRHTPSLCNEREWFPAVFLCFFWWGIDLLTLEIPADCRTTCTPNNCQCNLCEYFKIALNSMWQLHLL